MKEWEIFTGLIVDEPREDPSIKNIAWIDTERKTAVAKLLVCSFFMYQFAYYCLNDPVINCMWFCVREEFLCFKLSDVKGSSEAYIIRYICNVSKVTYIYVTLPYNHQYFHIKKGKVPLKLKTIVSRLTCQLCTIIYASTIKERGVNFRDRRTVRRLSHRQSNRLSLYSRKWLSFRQFDPIGFIRRWPSSLQRP